MSDGERTSRVRLRDVAEAAGVNPSIASRILNEDPTLSARPETRRRVHDTARRMGYTPNAFARGLKLQRTNTLGLVMPGVANAINAQVVQGAERHAARHGYVVLLADTGDFVRTGDVYRRLILERRVDGLIVSGPAGDALVADLNSHRIPYVLVNRRAASGALSVSADEAAGIALAVGHLVGCGHRRIGYVAGPAGSDSLVRGLDGYAAALARHGLDADVVREVEFTEEAGFRATEEVLATEPTVTGLVVASVTQSVGVLAAVRRAGRAVPADISVVALDDTSLAAYLDPPLTSVRMPLLEVAETAVEQVLRLIRGDAAHDVIVPTPPELIVRGSTAAPPVHA